MFKIFVDNQEIKLFGDTTIPGEYNNPLFNNDGSFSFDVEIPADMNGLLFDFPENPGARTSRQRNYEARIEHFGKTIFCRCRVSTASKKSYSLNFFFEESAFYNRLKNLRLDNMPYNESFSINVPQIATAMYNDPSLPTIEIGNGTNHLAGPYSTWFRNMELLRNPSSRFYLFGANEKILRYHVQSASYPVKLGIMVTVNADYYPEHDYHLVMLGFLTTHQTMLAPLQTVLQKKLNPNINQVFFFEVNVTEEKDLAFAISWNTLNHKTKWYLNSHNVTIFETLPALTSPDPAEKKYSFFPTKYLSYAANDQPIAFHAPDLANYSHGLYVDSFVWAAGSIDYHFQDVLLGKLFPSFFAKYILNAIEQITGFEFVIPNEVSDIENIVILGFVSLVNPDYFMDPTQDLYRGQFTPNEVLPWTGVSEFIINLAKATGTYPVINDIEQTFEFRPFTQTILNREYVEISNKVNEIEIALSNIPEGFIVKYNHPDPYFQRRHPSLIGKNDKGSVELLNELPQENNEAHDVYLVTSREQYFEWTGTQWLFYADSPAMELFFQPDQKNIFEYVIELCPSIGRSVFRPFGSTDKLLCPLTELEPFNIITGDHEAKKNIPLLYSVYRGMQKYLVSELTYPLLSHHRKNVRGEVIGGTNLSANIIGSDGLYIKRLKDYIFFLTMDPIACSIEANPTLDLVFPKTKIMIDGVKYLVEKAEWAFLHDGLSGFKCLLRKVNN